MTAVEGCFAACKEKKGKKEKAEKWVPYEKFQDQKIRKEESDFLVTFLLPTITVQRTPYLMKLVKKTGNLHQKRSIKRQYTEWPQYTLQAQYLNKYIC